MFWNLKMISDLDKHFGLATVLATFEKLGDFFKQSGLIALKVHQTLMAMFHLMVSLEFSAKLICFNQVDSH